MTTTDDAITERIPLPRTPDGPPDARPGDAPKRAGQGSRRPWRLVVGAFLVIALGMGAGALVGLFLRPAAPPASTAAGQPAPAASSPAAPPSPTAPTDSAAAGPACPSAPQLLEVFARVRPEYGTGARATGPVVCAGGYAVLTLRSSTTPDGLQTIYEVGPPVRFRNAGTGPICSDGSEDEGVVVPRSAAERLGCLTGSGPSSGGEVGAESSRSSGVSGADPYGCLAERAAQERSYDTGTPMSNAELRCNYNYGPTLPSTRETCWMADYDRDHGGGPPDERGRRDFEEGCAPFGY